MVDLDFTLTTKVLADGNVLIVFLNSRGHELHKFYMNQVEQDGDNQGRSVTLKAVKVGEW